MKNVRAHTNQCHWWHDIYISLKLDNSNWNAHCTKRVCKWFYSCESRTIFKIYIWVATNTNKHKQLMHRKHIETADRYCLCRNGETSTMHKSGTRTVASIDFILFERTRKSLCKSGESQCLSHSANCTYTLNRIHILLHIAVRLTRSQLPIQMFYVRFGSSVRYRICIDTIPSTLPSWSSSSSSLSSASLVGSPDDTLLKPLRYIIHTASTTTDYVRMVTNFAHAPNTIAQHIFITQRQFKFPIYGI